MRRGSSSALSGLILSVSAVLALTMALLTPTAALAEGTSNYGQTPSTPTKPATPTTPTPATPTTPTKPATTPAATTPAPSTGTLPSKESSKPKPKSKAAPSTTSTTPTATTPAAKATTLPFTGFDLRWTVGIGLLLMGAGFSIVTMQRRHRRDTGD